MVGNWPTGVEAGPGLPILGALAPKSMDFAPSPPYPPKSNREHFLRVSFIFLRGGDPRMERGNASIPELTYLKGKLFAHLGPFPQSFSTSPQTARGRGAWPLHLRATDAAGPSGSPTPPSAPASSGHQEGLHRALRSGLERNSLHLLSASVFPLQAPQPISQAPQQQHWRPPGNAAVRTPTRRWFSKGNKGQLAGPPGQCGTTLLTQETELLFFFI